MGILDDAIREHLDLKRKHGSPEEELQRQEEEALGPARRQVAQQADSSEAEADGDGDATATAVDEPALREDKEPPAEAATELLSLPASAPPAPDTEESDAVRLEDSGETPSRGLAALPEEDAGERSASGVTQEYDPFSDEEQVAGEARDDRVAGEEDHERGASDDDGEPFAEPEPDPGDGSTEEDGASGEADVLEDTPDFLQETPEHDRLWFEQKPPRDFDFD